MHLEVNGRESASLQFEQSSRDLGNPAEIWGRALAGTSAPGHTLVYSKETVLAVFAPVRRLVP